MMIHLFVFAFVFLMIAAMETTFPIKARSFTDRAGVECATGKVIPKPKDYVVSSVKPLTILKEESKDAESN